LSSGEGEEIPQQKRGEADRVTADQGPRGEGRRAKSTAMSRAIIKNQSKYQKKRLKETGGAKGQAVEIKPGNLKNNSWARYARSLRIGGKGRHAEEKGGK